MGRPQANCSTGAKHLGLRMQCIAKGDFGLRIIENLVGNVPVAGVVQPLLECRHTSCCQERISRVFNDLKKQFVRVVPLS